MTDDTDDMLELEQVLGLALAGEIMPAEMPAEQRVRLRDRVLERVRAGSGLRTVRAGAEGWVATTPLTETRALRVDHSATHRTVMFRLKPGGEFPAHSHRFEEETFVLEGEIEVGNDVLRAGDYQFAAPGSFHETIRSPGGALLLIRFQTRVAAAPPP